MTFHLTINNIVSMSIKVHIAVYIFMEQSFIHIHEQGKNTEFEHWSKIRRAGFQICLH